MSAPPPSTVESDKAAVAKKYQPGSDFHARTSQSRPTVPLGYGRIAERDPGSTAFVSPAAVEAPEKHADIQARASTLGAGLAERLAGMSKDDRAAEIGRMESLSTEMTARAEKAGILSGGAGAKAAALPAAFSGDSFRGVEKGLDEATQSQATAAFHQGFSEFTSTHPDADTRKDLSRMGSAFLQAQSAMRMPTQDVVAPGVLDGDVHGQRHPTVSGMPAIKGGASAHSYADRARADGWVAVGESLLADTRSVSVPMAATLTAAGAATTAHMSHPLSASNVASSSYGAPLIDSQRGHRESLKDQTRMAAKFAGIPVPDAHQAIDAPKGPWDAPASPTRDDPVSSLAEPSLKKRSAAAANLPLPPLATQDHTSPTPLMAGEGTAGLSPPMKSARAESPLPPIAAMPLPTSPVHAFGSMSPPGIPAVHGLPGAGASGIHFATPGMHPGAPPGMPAGMQPGMALGSVFGGATGASPGTPAIVAPPVMPIPPPVSVAAVPPPVAVSPVTNVGSDAGSFDGGGMESDTY